MIAYCSITVERNRGEFLLDDEFINTHHSLSHTISRASIYEDCIELYKNNLPQVVHEYPFCIAYKHEKAIDTGCVSRDFFFSVLGSGLHQGF